MSAIRFQTDLTYNVPIIEPDESFLLNASVTVKPTEIDFNVFDLGRDKRSFKEDVLDYLAFGEPLEDDPEVDVADREMDEEAIRHSRETQAESNSNVLPTPTSPPAAEKRPTTLVLEVCFQ